MDTGGLLPRVQSGRGVKLITQFYLVLQSIMVELLLVNIEGLVFGRSRIQISAQRPGVKRFSWFSFVPSTSFAIHPKHVAVTVRIQTGIREGPYSNLGHYFFYHD
jgi:hypothetical protein